MRIKDLILAILAAIASIGAAGSPAADVTAHATVPAVLSTSSNIQSLFQDHCVKCHGALKQKNGLDLRSLESMLKGGDDGPAVTPGKPLDSLVFQNIQPGAETHMPPKEEKPLTAAEINSVKDWIAGLPSLIPSGVSNPSEETSDSKPVKGSKWVPPADMQVWRVIDRFVEMGWQAKKVEPARLCDDRTFVRRVYLDLAGRIPTPTEEEAFLYDSRAGKRAGLVESLLQSEDYALRMREVFDVVLMERNEGKPDGSGVRKKWLEFLESSFRKNRPWNQIIADIILARPRSAEDEGAVWFLYQRKNDYQAMAEALAPVVFGVQIKCAQCHDHKVAHEILQKHYWGLVAAFNRGTNVETANGPGVAESAVGGFVSFTNLKKESQPAVLAFFNGKTVPEDRPAENAKEEDSPDNYVVPPPTEKKRPERACVPKFSRRAALADAATQANPLLARAFVNRIWELLLGRGLVHPVDEMDSKHPPSHPALLDWLADDFMRNNYDIQRLLRSIVLSRTYQLDSRPESKTAPPPETFAYGLEKPLSAEALSRSLVIASGNQPGPEETGTTGSRRNRMQSAFAEKFPDLFPVDYNATVSQAMFLSNNPLLDALLRPAGKNLTARLLACDDAEEKVHLGFKSVLGRLPDEEELSVAMAGLKARRDRKEAGVKEFVWALLTSAEFQLNH